MGLFYQHNINENTRLAIWEIKEPEEFFLQQVPIQREITHPQKRLQHLAGRYLLKYLFPDFPYDEMLIADTKKPYLPYEQYHFSISHCGNYAAAIASKNQRVGIDIEISTERVLKISHKFLNEEERKWCQVSSATHEIDKKESIEQPEQGLQPASCNLQLLTVLWSAKESVYKWWGWGSVDFSDHILLQPFSLNESGSFEAIFLRDAEQFLLQLQYRVFGQLCLVWLKSEGR